MFVPRHSAFAAVLALSGLRAATGLRKGTRKTAGPIVQADFKEGTVILSTPGLYTLREDIVFDPKTPLSSGISDADVHFPDPRSEKYPQTGGYFLGFFATISVVADNVVLDCQGHSIAMSPEFHKRQRFHALIELASKPFISEAGPPQFSDGELSPGELKVANNVTIRNCNLGLSAHHGIHGNENKGVTIQNVTIRDFEVAGIHLNGAENIRIEDADIGPNLKETFGAHLSQVIFLDHLMNTLLPTRPRILELKDEAMITLRGQRQTVGDVFRKLHHALQDFYAGEPSDLDQVAGKGGSLPDGSLVSGIVVHTTGPAVADFGACPMAKVIENNKMVSGLALKRVQVHDLALDGLQVTRLMLDGNQVMGPAGDVFDWRMNTDKNDRYIGNLLSDAQIAVGVFKKFLQGRKQVANLDDAALKWYFGGVHMPDKVIQWAEGRQRWSGGGEFRCDGDSMSHINKGATGLFISYLQDGVDIEKVQISNIVNEGGVDALHSRCVKDNYQGGDVRGVALVNSPAFRSMPVETLFDITRSGLRAVRGGTVIPIDRINT